MKERFSDFRLINRVRGLNRFLQIILILVFIGGLNFLSTQVYLRWDLTKNHRFSLSPETRASLRDLSSELEILVTIAPDSSLEEERILYVYMENLLREYVFLSSQLGEFPISVEFINVYRDLEKAETLTREFGLDQANTVVVRNGSKVRFLRPDDLIEFENRKPIRFIGEAAITSAILEVTQDRAPVIYALTGHGETNFSDADPTRGLSRLGNELRLRNFTLRTLDLSQAEAVPEDADLILLADPRGALLPSELEKLRTYLLDRAGRLFVFLRPTSKPEIAPLLEEWGILVDDRVIFEQDPASLDGSGSILIRNFAEHAITDSLIRNQTWLTSGLLRPVLPSSRDGSDERLKVTPLLASSGQSWAESTDLVSGRPQFDEATDLAGPVPIAMLAERRADDRLGINLPGGRLIVVGSGDLFANRRLGSLGNVNFFFQSLNWLMDRDRWIGIPPRQIESYQIALSQEQFRLVGVAFLFFPGAILILGLGIYWVRRIH